MLKLKEHYTTLDRYFMSQVPAMKENEYPLQGIITAATSKKFSDSEERTLTAQSGPNSETDFPCASLPYGNLERKTSSDPK